MLRVRVPLNSEKNLDFHDLWFYSSDLIVLVIKDCLYGVGLNRCQIIGYGRNNAIHDLGTGAEKINHRLELYFTEKCLFKSADNVKVRFSPSRYVLNCHYLQGVMKKLFI